VVSGKDKFYQIAFPAKEDPRFKAFSDLPEVTLEALEAKALMKQPVGR